MNRPEPTEDQLQIYAADKLRAFGAPGIVFFHVPNQNMASPQYRKKLNSFGLLPGVSDWIFVLPGSHVAFLELKTLRGVQSKSQKDFQRNVEALGAPYLIARTPEQIDGVLLGLGAILDLKFPRSGVGVGGRSGRGNGGCLSRFTTKFTEGRCVGS